MKNALKKVFLILIPAVFLLGGVSCSSGKLYSWGLYSEKCYDYTKNPSDWNKKMLKNQLEWMINHPAGSRGVVPPGILADYGYFLILEGETAQGVEYLEKEMELYPESVQFMKKIVEMFKEDEE